MLATNTVGYVAAPTLVGSLEPMATVIIWPNLENAHRNYLNWVIFFVFEGGSLAFRMSFMRTSVSIFFFLLRLDSYIWTSRLAEYFGLRFKLIFFQTFILKETLKPYICRDYISPDNSKKQNKTKTTKKTPVDTFHWLELTPL